MVVNAQSAAGIDDLERNALAPELPHQFAHALDGRAERRRRANLRADVNADAVGLKPSVAAQHSCRCESARRMSMPNLCSRRPVEM